MVSDSKLAVLEGKRRQARRKAIVVAVEYGILAGVEALGGELRGVSIRTTPQNYLMTLRVEFDSGLMIAFVGSDDLGSLLIKVVRELEGNKLRFREDAYRKGG